MTTRTLEALEAEAADKTEPGLDSYVRALVREAYVLGAASRASPEEGRERALYEVLWKVRVSVLTRSNLDGSANLSRKEVSAVRDAVRAFDAIDERLALRSPPPEETATGPRFCATCAHREEAEDGPDCRPCIKSLSVSGWAPASPKEGGRHE